MIREIENLHALMDLLALTGLKAGMVLTAQSLAYRPSAIDLLTAPRAQGGVFPDVEILLGSCGDGAAIEYLLTGEQLAGHLAAARRKLEALHVPPQWFPEGWWATMDAPLVPLKWWRQPRPVRWNRSAPYRLQVRVRPGSSGGEDAEGAQSLGLRPAVEKYLRGRLRRSRLKALFSPYRPYEGFAPGPLSPEITSTVREAGFSYMLSKSGFGKEPKIVHRQGDFVALNYTAGQWDGWTPFETINHVHDLKRAERSLLARRRPGWLLGSVDSCLWAFSGELWEGAPGLAAIARFIADGGASGRLVNVQPRVIARYARIIEARSGVGDDREREAREGRSPAEPVQELK
jgi:hypothetical protein